MEEDRCEHCGRPNDSSQLSVWSCGHVYRMCCTRKYLRDTEELKCPACHDPKTIMAWFPRPMYRRWET